MIKFIKVFVFVAVSVLTVACGSAKHTGKTPDAMHGTWQKLPIVIDGDSKDWPSPYPNYDAKAKVAYATSNDRDNLYITMETGDEMTQVKMLKQGMTVYIDTGGHKNADFSINFPLQNDNESIALSKKDFGEKKGRADNYEDKALAKKINDAALLSNQLTLEGFTDCNGGYLVKQTLPCGVSVRMRMDEYKELVWEAAIPFKAIYHKDHISAADAGRAISVCFAVKGFKKADSKGSGNDNAAGSGMNNGMGGAGTNSAMRGGGRGGGKGRGSASAEDPMQHLYESTKTWKYFEIAYEN